MDNSFEMLRAERRSFFCPNTLWKKLKEKTKDCMSISQYVRMAIKEKMEKEEPEEEKSIKELMKY